LRKGKCGNRGRSVIDGERADLLTPSPGENHVHAMAIYLMHYNFVRLHQTLRCTPAMPAGVSKTLWSLEDMVAVVDQWETARKAPEPMPEATEQY